MKIIKRCKEELRDYILAGKWVPARGFLLAFYNPPGRSFFTPQ